MKWNTNMDEAPRGDFELKKYTHWKSGEPYTRELRVRKPILISVSGEVLNSFWSDIREHWVGCADEEMPDAWMHWPEPYVKETV